MICICGRSILGKNNLCRRCTKSARNGANNVGNPGTYLYPALHNSKADGSRNNGQRNHSLIRGTRTTKVGLLVTVITLTAIVPLFVSNFTTPLVTLAILSVTIVTSVQVMNQRVDANDLLLDNNAVHRGEKLRLISSTLVHGDRLHLFFNSFALWSFGTGVERIFTNRFGDLGGVAYGLFYLFACVASSYLTVGIATLRRKQHLSVGASGAVLVLVSFFAVLYPTATFFILFIPMPAWLFLFAFTLVSLYAAMKLDTRIDKFMTFGRGRVDHVGHLSGIAVGFVSALIFL